MGWKMLAAVEVRQVSDPQAFEPCGQIRNRKLDLVCLQPGWFDFSAVAQSSPRPTDPASGDMTHRRGRGRRGTGWWHEFKAIMRNRSQASLYACDRSKAKCGREQADSILVVAEFFFLVIVVVIVIVIVIIVRELIVAEFVVVQFVIVQIIVV